MKMNENKEENSKGSINRIYPIIGENEQKQTINDFKNEVNIVPIKLKLSPELLSRNKTNLDSLSKRLDSYGEEISKMNKKHKVSFIDQVSTNKNIAQIIYIDDQSSAQDCKKNAERYSVSISLSIFSSWSLDTCLTNTFSKKGIGFNSLLIKSRM